jgi:hypothetical protein
MIPTILGQNPSSTTLIVGRAIGIYHTFLRNQNLDEHEPFSSYESHGLFHGEPTQFPKCGDDVWYH